MSSEYRHNHYVPVWYQNRFLSPATKDRELYYLDLCPGTFTDPRGVVHAGRAVRRLGFKHCFAEDNLYTAKFGKEESTRIEQIFFGQIDSRGKKAVEYLRDRAPIGQWRRVSGFVAVHEYSEVAHAKRARLAQ